MKKYSLNLLFLQMYQQQPMLFSPVQRPSFRLFDKVFKRAGLDFSFVDLTNQNALRADPVGQLNVPVAVAHHEGLR